MKQIIYILFLFLFLPQIVSAQSKPKRDASKDRSVIVEKRENTHKRTPIIAERKRRPARRNTRKETTVRRNTRKETTVRRNTRKETTARRSTRKKTTASVIQTATYLRVNPASSFSEPRHSNGGQIVFDVATDGKNWTISNLPYWCHVRKYPNWFVIDYDANTKHEDRQGWFEVKSDNQRVRINVSQQGAPINIQAHFNGAYLLHNQYVPSLGNCLKITSEVAISGAFGQKCWVVAYIIDEEGYNVKAKNGYQNYALPSSNNIYVASEVIPSTDKKETFTIVSYIPNNAMRLLKKNNNLQCKLVIYCVETNEYVSGATYTMKFRAKSKRGVVTTKYPK